MRDPPVQPREEPCHIRLAGAVPPATTHRGEPRDHLPTLQGRLPSRPAANRLLAPRPRLLPGARLEVLRVRPAAALGGRSTGAWARLHRVAQALDALADVHQARLLRLPLAPQCLPQNPGGDGHGPLGLFPRLASHDDGIRPAREPAALLGHPAVPRRQADGGPPRTGPPPWGPPVRVGRHLPSSLTPARSLARTRWRTRPARIASASRSMRVACALGSQNWRRSASTRPTFPSCSARQTWRLAAWGERPWRSPTARSRHVGSQIGAIRWTSACWQTRSTTRGRPSLLTPPAAWGLSTRCPGWGWYVPSRSVPGRRSSASSVRASNCALVTSSMPAPPRCFWTFSQASAQLLRRTTLSRRAWTFCCPCLPAEAWGCCGSTVASVPAWGLSPRELSPLPVPPHRLPHVARAQPRTGPSPAARPVASGAAAAPGRGPRPCAVAAVLRHRPRSAAGPRVGPHGARASLRAYRAGASGRGVGSPWPARSSAGVPRCRPDRPCGRDQGSLGPPRLVPTVSSAPTGVRWGGTRRLRLPSAGSTLPPRWPTGSSWGGRPALTTRGCSASPAAPPSRWAPCPPASCARRASGPPGLWPAFALVPG
jgi:hypothetical protein